jgi:hypothetical protein
MTLDKQTRARAITHAKPRQATGKHALSVWVPIHVISSANARDAHWGQRKARTDAQRAAVAYALRGLPLPELPAVVTMTRVGKKVLDSDNHAAALKSCRDQVAAEYGVDDADPRLVFENPDSCVGIEGAVHILIRPMSLLSLMLEKLGQATVASHGRQLGRAK